MEITANAIQTIETNQDVLFTDTAVSGNSSILHREGSGLVTLRGITTQCRARFRVTFGGNVAIPTTGTQGPISLALAINGEPVATTTMISTPGDTGDYNCVFSSIFLDVPCGCCTQIAVKNITSQAILVQNANFIIERVA
jgi:hypothetical protein